MELSRTIRDHVVRRMVGLVSTLCGPDFDFVLVLRAGRQEPYVLTDVVAERARNMLRDALDHPDTPP